jgi:hypothetical protein
MSVQRGLMLSAMALAAVVSAQDMGVRVQVRGPAPGVVVAGPETFQYVRAESFVGDTVVKGQPYSADAVTEITQTLADGNRIVHKNTAHIYRDSLGRTRREQSLNAIGPWTSDGPAPELITINDPVTGTGYMLNPATRTATKLARVAITMGADPKSIAVTKMIGAMQVDTEARATADEGGLGVRVFSASAKADGDMPQPTTESLGTQIVDGVSANGTRTTVTIPAGQIGNEQEIKIVTETWYSPDLQTVVKSTRDDPMTGTTVFELTNLSRDEPPASLFQVPDDYKVVDSKGPEMIFRSVRKPQ